MNLKKSLNENYLEKKLVKKIPTVHEDCRLFIFSECFILVKDAEMILGTLGVRR